MRRLCIFFFYDKDGIVDDYVPFLLSDLKHNCNHLWTVVNGSLTPEGREKIEQHSDEVFVRENTGFDVWAYKESLQRLRDKLADCDELLLCNHTFFGPLFPFSEMFGAMDQKQDLDFWGITAYHQNKYYPYHLQSHFIVVRKRMHQSAIFQHYWDSLPMIHSYQESIDRHETTFTQFFSDRGFRHGVYSDNDLSDNPLLHTPVDMIQHRRCPIIKRRSFFHANYSDLMYYGGYRDCKRLLEVISTCGYDADLVWQNILRTTPSASLLRSMALIEVLSDQAPPLQDRQRKLAVIAHVYHADELWWQIDLALSCMPDGTDVVLTTDTSEKKQTLESRLAESFPRLGKKEVRLVENRGRDVSALLVAARDVVLDGGYEYICHVHDKMCPQNLNKDEFALHIWNNMFHSKVYVQNVLAYLDQHPRLGVAMPPMPHNGDYYFLPGSGWSGNFELTKKLVQQFSLRIAVDDQPGDDPVAPYGGIFWFRPKALSKLVGHSWAYSDFPTEPIGDDNTILHAIERAYGYFAMDAGFAPAYICHSEDASLNLLTLYTKVQLLNVYSDAAACNNLIEHTQLLQARRNEPPRPPGSVLYQWKKHIKTVHPTLSNSLLAPMYKTLRWTWRKVKPR